MQKRNSWHAVTNPSCCVNSSFFVLHSSLKSTRLQPQSYRLFEVEHQVHVVDGLAAGTLQQVVDARDDEQLVAVLLQVDEALVGVDYLLQVDVLVDDVREGILGIVFFVHAADFLESYLGLHDDGGEDAAGEVTTIGDEVDFGVEAVLELAERLLDFGHVLVFESLVDTQVVVAPAEVARGTRLDACARAARDGVHHDVVVQHQVLGQGKQAQLDAGGEAAGIGHVLGRAGGATVQLGKAVDEVVVVALEAVVHREVDDFQVFGHVVALQELARVAMGGAEEEHVDVVQRELVGEGQVGFAVETFVHVGYLVAGVARAVDEDDFRLRMVQQQADEFACRVAGSADNSYFNHNM